MNESTAPQTQSPFATPAAAPATPLTAPPAAPAASPFAAPAQTAAAPAPVTPTDTGDTSFLDDVPSHEPLVKPCTVPGVIAALEAKVSQASGNPFLSVAVQLYGDKMTNETGDPISPGKRLTTTIFASSKTEEGLKRAGRTLKNTLLALRNVPLDGKGDANPDTVYKGWPPAEKVGLVAGANGAAFSLAPFMPAEKWVGTKVMVEVRIGKDMDGVRRNEFNLLAASTKPVERKARS